ncbi:Metallo-dependent hydrolase [Aulographum hederae CBS 113979]|uniref:Metallo-dependent hydrolase n=1 Tax=Aulographum hederae CBS 113979 TaxID=1176131 RepID=A0A6G1HAQ1_9PEZI|nr:Metallo-dependent hydrolase [Aulographum hederae CBS 113979]
MATAAATSAVGVGTGQALEQLEVNHDFARSLPKIELHAHLSGSISRKCLHEVWTMKKAEDPNLAVEDPLLAIPPDKVDYDLETFFPLFSSYIYKLCSDKPSIIHTTRSVLQDFQSDNVVYLELRTTPRAIPDQNISKKVYVEAILACLTEHNNLPTNTLSAKLILSVDRRNTLQQAEEVIDLALAYRDAGIVGVDLCGDPTKGPITTFTSAFARAKRAGLKITLHFAEAPTSASDEELWELLRWAPDRIGHVIHVNDEVKREIVRRGVGVELCLSCNVHARMITGGFGEHHFGWWWKGGSVGVALSTDDVGVFCSPLSNEYVLAATHFGLSRADVKELCLGAVEIIFGEEAEKERLREVYRSWAGW